MPIKVCSEASFFLAWGSLTSLKSQTRDPQLEVPPGGLVLRVFTSWKKSIYLSRVWTREPLISRRARHPETTEAYSFSRNHSFHFSVNLFIIYCELFFSHYSQFIHIQLPFSQLFSHFFNLVPSLMFLLFHGISFSYHVHYIISFLYLYCIDGVVIAAQCTATF